MIENSSKPKTATNKTISIFPTRDDFIIVRCALHSIRYTRVVQNFLQKNIFYYGAVFDLLVLDQVTKILANNNLTDGKSIELIPQFLSIAVSHNSAIAFSLPIPGIYVAFVTPLLIAALLYYIAKTCDTTKVINKIAMVLIVAGAIGNFIDRVRLGFVIDFIDFSFFPSFNCADSYLTIGVIVLLIGSRLYPQKQDSNLVA